jgi:hypothetical protein
MRIGIEEDKMTYEIIKGRGKTMWCVHDTDDGDVMRFYSKRECEAWIAKAERNAAKDAEWAEIERKARVEKVEAYLAVRAFRKAEAAKQGAFNF